VNGRTDIAHAWFEAQFAFSSWIQCTCGYRPHSQDEMDAHGPDDPRTPGYDDIDPDTAHDTWVDPEASIPGDWDGGWA